MAELQACGEQPAEDQPGNAQSQHGVEDGHDQVHNDRRPTHLLETGNLKFQAHADKGQAEGPVFHALDSVTGILRNPAKGEDQRGDDEAQARTWGSAAR